VSQTPLDIEIVTHVTGSMNHCSHCQVFVDGAGIGGQVHAQDMSSYPEEFIRDWERLSDWVRELTATFSGRLMIHITDAGSPRGLWKNLRNGIRRYPAFIIDGHEIYQGWDKEQLASLIQRHSVTG
jgi:hypothetical protein